MTKTTILTGDCREILKTLPDASVHCCVTSPPYFGLRDYGHAGQMGLEQTPDEYVAGMVGVFREVRRVLRDDGTLWLNLGDSYASSGGVGQPHRDSSGGIGNKGTRGEQGYHAAGGGFARPDTARDGLKPKDLIGIPWRVAFALQADGWYLRQDIIWHKPNPMPESVTDRCTKAHEYIFLLSKKEKYYFDHEAIKEPLAGKPHKPGNKLHADKISGPNDRGGHSQWERSMGKTWGADGKRNKRDVWTVATKPYKGAHFATFPTTLIEPCVKAGCPVGGTVLDPFGGSGTTGQVAQSLGRSALLIELNPAYIPLIEHRTQQLSLA